jgi:(E)-4-hydroxy-3-methylbut-2-enyl-diphosphate synthase
VFQRLAERIEGFVRERMPTWAARHEGVEGLRLAVMGCIVNGPGESRAANVGISLPGTGETPTCPVFVDGAQVATLKGTSAELTAAFEQIIEDYVASHYPSRPSAGQ